MYIHNINYRGIIYPLRDIDVEVDGETETWIIGTTELNDALFPDGNYADDEAESIDSMIYGFVDEKDLRLMNDELFAEFCYDSFS